MPQIPDKNRIEDLKKMLDSRVEREIPQPEVILKQRQSKDVQSAWQHESEEEDVLAPVSLLPEKHSALPKRLFFGSLIFFLIAVGAAGFAYFKGSNTISSDNIDISVSGPVSVAGGQELILDVTVKNQNNTDLELSDLRVIYPEGTRNPDNLAVEQLRTTDSLGDIPSGQAASQRIRAVLFGQENTTKSIILNVEYRVKGSNAIFQKEKTVDIALTSAPVSMTVSSLKEINSNQDIEFVLDLTSNSPQIIKGLMVKAEYGFGFTYAGADPQPVSGQNIWYIGDIRPGEKRTIKVRGKIEGQDGEDRSFRFSTGIQGGVDKKALQPEFLSVSQVVSIKKPFIGVNLSFDGDTSSTYSIRPARNIRADIAWVNNLPAKVLNAKIVVKLSGAILDKSSVAVDKGFYNSSANTITWDQTTNPELASLEAGDSGRVSFSLASLAPSADTLATFKNAEITVNVDVQGSRIEDNQVPQQVVSSANKKIRVASEVALTPRVVYSVGPFQNKGPIPPRVETETTYSVVWTLTNTVNDMRDVKVVAVIPPYVKWLDVISPASEQVTYNATTGEVVWNAGEVKAGTGFSGSPRQAVFQISFTPSVTQVNSSPSLIGDMTISGIDRFTNTSFSFSKQGLTTRINTDPAYQAGNENVAR